MGWLWKQPVEHIPIMSPMVDTLYNNIVLTPDEWEIAGYDMRSEVLRHKKTRTEIRYKNGQEVSILNPPIALSQAEQKWLLAAIRGWVTVRINPDALERVMPQPKSCNPTLTAIEHKHGNP